MAAIRARTGSKTGFFERQQLGLVNHLMSDCGLCEEFQPAEEASFRAAESGLELMITLADRGGRSAAMAGLCQSGAPSPTSWPIPDWRTIIALPRSESWRRFPSVERSRIAPY